MSEHLEALRRIADGRPHDLVGRYRTVDTLADAVEVWWAVRKTLALAERVNGRRVA